VPRVPHLLWFGGGLAVATVAFVTAAHRLRADPVICSCNCKCNCDDKREGLDEDRTCGREHKDDTLELVEGPLTHKLMFDPNVRGPHRLEEGRSYIIRPVSSASGPLDGFNWAEHYAKMFPKPGKNSEPESQPKTSKPKLKSKNSKPDKGQTNEEQTSSKERKPKERKARERKAKNTQNIEAQKWQVESKVDDDKSEIPRPRERMQIDRIKRRLDAPPDYITSIAEVAKDGKGKTNGGEGKRKRAAEIDIGPALRVPFLAPKRNGKNVPVPITRRYDTRALLRSPELTRA